jgi:carboxymethylenebutenolidase
MSATLAPAQQRMLDAYLRHTRAEFETRRVEDAIASMVETPHVLLLPSLEGGFGREAVADFYAKRFVFSMPPDMQLELLTRIVASDHIVEECVMRFTHTQEIPWLLPGISATGKRCEMAVCVVVKLSGEKVEHEHIYWDQAAVLRQLGLLDSSAGPAVGVEAVRALSAPSEIAAQRASADHTAREGKP